jgi:hypothetical protein
MTYDALSYCWGDLSNPELVDMTTPSCNGASTTVKVSSNLAMALRHLRKRDTQRTFWIDFICINQSDDIERSHQVALMGEIFDCADNVYVWLGQEDQSINDSMGSLRELGQFHATSPKPFGILGDRSKEITTTEDEKPREIVMQSEALWLNVRPSLKNFFLRPWFKRVWVLQEVWSHISRKPKNVVVLCGTVEAPWEAILHANYSICVNQPFPDTGIMPAVWSQLFQMQRRIDHPAAAEISTERMDILTIFISSLDMEASDPRDKLFALLVFGEETYRVSELPNLIRPDYTKTELQVFSDFTRWWIENNRSLRILSVAHTQPGRTWIDMDGFDSSKHDAYDFSCRPSWVIWHHGLSEWSHGSLAIHKEHNYNASGGRMIDIKVLQSSSSDSTLSLMGLRLGIISSISHCTFRHIRSDQQLMRAYEHVFDPCGARGIWRLHKKPLDPSNSPPCLDFSTFWKTNFAHYSAHWHYPGMRETYNCKSNDPLDHWFPCHGKILFHTDSGKIGLCPYTAREGDIITILYGGQIPYILRPKNDKEFYFIGECFLQGFMNGEAFNALDTAQLEETFTLV